MKQFRFATYLWSSLEVLMSTILMSKIIDINTSREDQRYVSRSELFQSRNERTKDRVKFNPRLALNLERIKIKLRFVKKLFNLEYDGEEKGLKQGTQYAAQASNAHNLNQILMIFDQILLHVGV